MSIKKAIEQDLANLRSYGVQVYELHVEKLVFDVLHADPAVTRIPSADSETTLRMNTCNGSISVRQL